VRRGLVRPPRPPRVLLPPLKPAASSRAHPTPTTCPRPPPPPPPAPLQGSWFAIICASHDPDNMLPRTPAGDFFIDRNGAMFAYVLEYLRACANSELTFPLPDNAR